jgi:4-amino-4-deoxy-L-arabinose transferase-like glycosyltransferase
MDIFKEVRNKKVFGKQTLIPATEQYFSQVIKYHVEARDNAKFLGKSTISSWLYNYFLLVNSGSVPVSVCKPAGIFSTRWRERYTKKVLKLRMTTISNLSF